MATLSIIALSRLLREGVVACNTVILTKARQHGEYLLGSVGPGTGADGVVLTEECPVRVERCMNASEHIGPVPLGPETTKLVGHLSRTQHKRGMLPPRCHAINLPRRLGRSIQQSDKSTVPNLCRRHSELLTHLSNKKDKIVH
jgi:hypothetical protein